MELNVLNINGQETGRKVTLDASVFGVEPNDHVIYLDVKRYLANKRQGTHKTKERAEVAYSTRKLFRQKGTGGARRGSIKSPLLRGGGTVFGPRPRDYEQKINKKVKRLARVSALSLKAQENAIVVVEDFNFEAPKTKQFAGVLKALQLNDVKSLMLLGGLNETLLKSSRNIPTISIMQAEDVSTYNIMNAKQLVLTESALTMLTDLLGKE
ncbi:50S ribosomal protein L4 [Porphyromonas levii]|uniref:Large ribosomal subunit protein uL4 n=1 Tax=Porphyromonas levii TaxID=28114 RepID=A0A4Y8WRA9_9PORP|nr:50S ribosomal protein L4 [Porphyromonas levii]MBR8703835.1 50S ribosomal protein L4 [Porphyromonas levii]MBR8713754.1 50S ribosomal protein L4 [Porphyromonas levii]MBR8715767.1 50S ribosomal protein L4 [Porphyromonas levii]MBR8728315.1 50S ribosomal protein L4 [Porphyromonas levii]MBR8729365.1 50S ribosomal protein L4 [Porphyromonas levii]